MNQLTRNETNYVGYEYKDITVKRRVESVYADGYSHFGWTLDSTSAPAQHPGSVTMKFKRDRKIRNKVELTRLQRQFDAAVTEIEALENSKVILASAAAYATGVAGTAFMAGSVFANLDGSLVLSIILAIPGFAGWIIPYLLYTNISKKKTSRVAPLIDQKYDELYELGQRANSLLVN
ncbi:hypothetical protein [Paenibacillus sp. MMS20-IR301]|uniref:hypothetical protein n=1 Tax=Paenibacillus sp. MMS20-IR301 TaxID=2895946 RepID=UPI0028E9D84E|nr:hypothetical protein [Paenibacillus sp. MMS20-IR301]WNS43918.1 hypothetical protein LOS79_01240 [Paenibacillus sp. MMS20-IR301]